MTLKISRQEIDDFIAEIKGRHRRFRFLPNNDIETVRRVDNSLFIYNLFFKGTGDIDEAKNQLSFKVDFRFPLKFFGLLIPLFIISFLFAPDVQINGNSSPSLLDRVGFTFGGLALFSIPYLIFFGLKRDFTRKIVGLLETKTGANRAPAARPRGSIS